MFLYLQYRYAEAANENWDDGRPEHALDTQSLISARNVKPNARRDNSILGVQRVVISMNGSMSHASYVSFAENVGHTPEVIEETLAECENIFAACFPAVDRTKIETIFNDIISSESNYLRPEAPMHITSPDEDGEGNGNNGSTENKAFGPNVKCYFWAALCQDFVMPVAHDGGWFYDFMIYILNNTRWMKFYGRYD